MKYVLIFNGHPKSGKTTFENALAKKHKSIIYSSITPIIKLLDSMIDDCEDGDLVDLYIYSQARKLADYRKLLSNMKRTICEFDGGDYVNSSIIRRIVEFLDDDSLEFFMVDIREPEFIRQLINELSLYKNRKFKVLTVFVNRDNNRLWGNPSDDDVENYQYDIAINNTGSLETLTHECLDEFLELLASRWEM